MTKQQPHELAPNDPKPTDRVPLAAIAHGRSGDKGNHANVAVIAYTAAGYQWLREFLTAEAVAQYFAPLRPSRVERFEAPNVRGLNFVLYDVLAGGASRSLRSDSQGKALAVALLRMPVPLDQQTAARLSNETIDGPNVCTAENV